MMLNSNYAPSESTEPRILLGRFYTIFLSKNQGTMCGRDIIS